MSGQHRDVLRFDRVGDRERLSVAANLGDSSATVRLGEAASLLAASDRGCSLRDGAVTLPPHTAVVALGD